LRASPSATCCEPVLSDLPRAPANCFLERFPLPSVRGFRSTKTLYSDHEEDRAGIPCTNWRRLWATIRNQTCLEYPGGCTRWDHRPSSDRIRKQSGAGSCRRLGDARVWRALRSLTAGIAVTLGGMVLTAAIAGLLGRKPRSRANREHATDLAPRRGGSPARIESVGP
jgi:hypothetical protein